MSKTLEATPNYFSLLGLEPHFDLDLTLLDQRYAALQIEMRQQAAQAQTTLARLENAQKVADVNRAYGCLKGDVSRAYHVLFLKEGQHFDEDGITFQDPEVLQDILDFHEAMDTAAPVEKMRLLKHLEGRLQAALDDLKQAFYPYDRDQVLKHLRRYGYWLKAQKACGVLSPLMEQAC